MPQYINRENLTFTDKNGNKIVIKEFREIPEYDTSVIIKDLPEKIDLDELASRDEVFGEGAEYLAFTIFEHNKIKIAENNFNVNGLKRIRIPVIREIL